MPDRRLGETAGLVIASAGFGMARGRDHDVEAPERGSTFDEALRRAAADPRPIVLVAEAGIDVARVARTLHELAGLRGRFVEREWARLRDASRDIPEALAEATAGTLFLHGEGLPALLPAAVRTASVQVILAIHPDARRGLDPEFRRAAQKPLVIALLRESLDRTGREGEPERTVRLEQTSVRDLAKLSYREFTRRAWEHLARAYLVELLRTHHGSVTHAAIQAGIARETLHRLLKRHGLRPRDFRAGGRGRDRSHHV